MTKERDMNIAILLLIAVSQQPAVKAREALNYFAQGKSLPGYFRQNKFAPSGQMNLQADAKPTGGCVIPLLNALKDKPVGDNKMPIIKPQGSFKMPVVTPVPDCEMPTK
jgi:hypothetical protein